MRRRAPQHTYLRAFSCSSRAQPGRAHAHAVNALSRIRNLEWVPVTPEICLKASVLVKHYQLSPFDGYHAATALGRDAVVLSTDQSYDRVTGLSRVNPQDMVKT